MLGVFNNITSDVDILAVCKQSMTAAEKDSVAARLSRTALPCSVDGLELSIVTLYAIESPLREPQFQLQITTMPGDAKVLDGEGQPGDPDLMVDFAVCRQSGRSIGDFSLPCSGTFLDMERR